MTGSQFISRRTFLVNSGLLLAGTALKLPGTEISDPAKEPIIDVHVHTDYHGRTNRELVAHQKTLGVTTSILLPAWRPDRDLKGIQFYISGRERWETTGNEACFQLAREYPDLFISAVNEVPGLPETISTLEHYLEKGAPMIGELKFAIACDAPAMQEIYQLAQSYNVPVLMHWQHGSYNYGFERFHKMLEKYPEVNFIGHAQTWWAHIDKGYDDQSNLYPEGEVTPGGLTDRLLGEYPNMYGELSAGSGLNALTRDEEHAREFLNRHQDKLMFGSDCGDPVGRAPDCRAAVSIATIRRLSPSKEVERKVLYENAKKLLQL